MNVILLKDVMLVLRFGKLTAIAMTPPWTTDVFVVMSHAYSPCVVRFGEFSTAFSSPHPSVAENRKIRYIRYSHAANHYILWFPKIF